MRTALTIAGSDPSGGAGAQGDLKTFCAHGVYGMAVLTALTAQNTRGVCAVQDLPPEFVRQQLLAIFSDLPVHAAKTGMLSRASTIEAVAEVLDEAALPLLVVDPVMVATSGDALLAEDAVEVMVARLFPLATLVTPNLPEAERLTGVSITSAAAMREAALILRRRGARAVLVKGGHLPGEEIVDLLHVDGEFTEYRHARVGSGAVHGTGCALAAAVTAHLAQGVALNDAVGRARAFVHRGIVGAVALGGGALPLNHLA